MQNARRANILFTTGVNMLMKENSMPSLGELLKTDAILFKINGTDRRSVLSQMAEAAAKIYGIDAIVALENLLAREHLGGTGLSDGVATPHARLKGLGRTIGVFALLENPIDFDAADGRPSDLVFMLLSPEDSGSMHLKALSKITRVLRQASIRASIRAARSAPAIAAIFEQSAQDQVA